MLVRSPSRRELAWWAPVLLTVHNAEEALTFRGYLPGLPALLPEPFASLEARLSYPVLVAALGALSVLAILIAALASSGGRRAWWALLVMEATMALNVIVHVGAAALVFRGYAPGVITAVTVNAPFAAYLFRRTARERWVSPAALWATAPAAVVLHGPVLFAGLWTATQWTR